MNPLVVPVSMAQEDLQDHRVSTGHADLPVSTGHTDLPISMDHVDLPISKEVGALEAIDHEDRGSTGHEDHHLSALMNQGAASTGREVLDLTGHATDDLMDPVGHQDLHPDHPLALLAVHLVLAVLLDLVAPLDLIAPLLDLHRPVLVHPQMRISIE